MPRLICGAAVLDQTIERLRVNATLSRARVFILHFSHGRRPGDPATIAAAVSTRVKARALRLCGFQVDVVHLADGAGSAQAHAVVAAIRNERSLVAWIAQRPVPADFDSLLCQLPTSADVDCHLASGMNATAAAIVRLLDTEHVCGRIAVVGAQGFVGASVVRELKARGAQLTEIERRDSLDGLAGCAAVVSAAGVPHLISQNLGAEHRLLVDAGFTPVSSAPFAAKGDIAPEAVPPAARYTPVPGGVGPLQVAVLIERCATRREDLVGA